MEQVPVYEEAPVYTDRQRRKPVLDGLSAVDLNWQHPAESNGAGGMCVEMAAVPGGIAVRDSSDPNVMLGFSQAEIDIFLRAVAGGEFNRLRLLSDRA